MTTPSDYRIIKITDGLGLDKTGVVIQTLTVEVFLVEFEETKTFLVPEAERDTIPDKINEWLEFRRNLG